MDHGSVDQSGLVLKELAVFEVGVQHGFESGDGCVVVVLAGSVALLACEYCAQSQRLPASLDIPEQVFGADFFPEVATDHVVNGGGVVQVPGDNSASQVAAVSVPQIQIFDLVRLAGFNERVGLRHESQGTQTRGVVLGAAPASGEDVSLRDGVLDFGVDVDVIGVGLGLERQHPAKLLVHVSADCAQVEIVDLELRVHRESSVT